MTLDDGAKAPGAPPPITLNRPGPALLPGYIAALNTGWSPSNTQDLSQVHLADIARDAAAFLASYDHAPGATTTLADGSVVEKLPGPLYWIGDGAFCGVINLRYLPGTTDLPDTVSGHIGYAIVPWKRRQGIGLAALKAILPIAAAAGLPRVLLTADPGNTASRRLIEQAGGILDPALPASARYDPRVGYWLPTPQTAR